MQEGESFRYQLVYSKIHVDTVLYVSNSLGGRAPLSAKREIAIVILDVHV